MINLQRLLSDSNFGDIEVITSLNNENSDIPSHWQQLISAKDISEKRTILMDYWRPVANELPKTLALINDHLDDAAVIKENGEYLLIYVFDSNNSPSVYIGHMPTDSGPFIQDMPKDIAMFYKMIHNGWYEKVSGGLGFLQLEQIDWLSSNEWGILDEIPAPDFDLNKVFYIFHNAGPGYLCINITDADNPKYLIFWTNKPPKVGLEFWTVMDSWIEIGLTN
jgi:hypothetical protein